MVIYTHPISGKQTGSRLNAGKNYVLPLLFLNTGIVVKLKQELIISRAEMMGQRSFGKNKVKL